MMMMGRVNGCCIHNLLDSSLISHVPQKGFFYDVYICMMYGLYFKHNLNINIQKKSVVHVYINVIITSPTAFSHWHVPSCSFYRDSLLSALCLDIKWLIGKYVYGFVQGVNLWWLILRVVKKVGSWSILFCSNFGAIGENSCDISAVTGRQLLEFGY